MRKAASNKLGALATLQLPAGAGHRAHWPAGVARLFAMPISTQSFANLLLGTHQSHRARVGLHVAFWLLAYPWYTLQSQWLVGPDNTPALVLSTLARLGFALVTFYAVSACIGRGWPLGRVLLLVLLVLAASMLGYCLAHYYLYTYLDRSQPNLPPYFHKLAANVSKNGPWTFLQSIMLYFYALQLFMAYFLPFTIKGVRAIVQAHLRTVTLEKDNLKLELEFLRAQINPHFLFNTLNSVYSLVEDKDQTAAALVLSLSNMMRYTLHDATATEVEVTQELDFIREYLDIQQIRHSRRLSVDVQIAPALGGQRIPPLLLVTFLENAVKHGVEKLLKEAWVRVRAYRDEHGAFCFEVANARPPQAEAALGEGIGLRNTRRRLSILYPHTHSLHIDATAAQYHVLLRLWQ